MLKRKLYLALIALCISLSMCTQSYAFTRPGVSEPVPAPPASPQPGTSTPPTTVVVEPEYTVYTPKITQLHNVNAMVYSYDKKAVYYIPTLESLPVNLKDLVTNLETANESHQFALVYDGYFNTEAHNASEVAKVDLNANASPDTGDISVQVLASADLYNRINPSPALKHIGYDLLLSKETYTMSKEQGKINFDYKVNEVADSNLTYNTIVMDLYKALGQYKYDIKFAFGIDPDFDPNNSPILQELSVLTSAEGNYGVDDSEANTYVAVTRTNPDQYWEQYLADRILLTPESKSTEACYDYRSGVSKASNANLTYVEFFQVACAMLNLYGESSLTSEEVEAYFNVYGTTFPKGMFNDRQASCVKYLVAKGIVDPDFFKTNDIEYTDPVTFAGIEDILYRIANKDARLTIKMQSLVQPALQAAGYTNANVTIADGLTDYTEYDYDTSQFYDFLIEIIENKTAFYAKSEDVVSSYTVNGEQGESSSKKPKTLALSNLRLTRTPNEASEFIQPSTSIGTGSDSRLFTYMYEGIIEIGDKKYYHFKVNPSYFNGCNTFYLTYEWENAKSVNEAYAEEPYNDSYIKYVKIGKPLGGVYGHATNGAKKITRKSFSDLSFDYSFKDNKTLDNNTIKGPASSEQKIISVGVKSNLINKSVISNMDINSNYKWSNMFSNAGLIENQRIEINEYTHAMWFPPSSNSGDYNRLEILTSNLDEFKQTEFYMYLVSNTEASSIKTASGYYRAEDGSLLVSFNYLKSKGIVTGISALDNEEGYLLTLGDFGTNVTIMNGDDKKYVIVGDTIYGNLTDETLVCISDNDYYINYKACLGWASSFVCIPVADGSIMAMSLGEFTQNGAIVENSVKPVKTFFPNATTNLMYKTISYSAGRGTSIEGFSLAGSYGLAPYTLVMADENNCDYLFVWHIRETNVNGKKFKVSKTRDKNARQKFKALTGINVPKDDLYTLSMYTLDRDENYNGLKFAKVTNVYRNLSSQDITYGWIYDPPKYNSITKGINSYGKAGKRKADKLSEGKKYLILPIFEYNGAYYDANVNMCSETAGAELKPVGTMLGSMCTSNNTNKVAKITSTGIYEFTTTEFTNDWQVYTAPVGMFSELKSMGKKKAKDCTSGALYFGTSICNIRNGKITILERPTSFKPDSPAVCTYKGVGNSSIYAASAKSISLSEDILKEADKAIESLVEDPSSIVDWGQYKFDRLVKNLDAWSTVVLIFVLNILPRVAMFVFFILMILSLAVNIKPWRMFCERVFDVYSFLTLGHMSVHTVDMKRLLLVSLACFSLFLIIMDGQLFNFIIFIAKFFIALYQR